MEQKISLTKGQVIRVTIDNLNHQGEGVTRYKNFVLFVPGGVPGDELLVEILSIKKNFARSRIKEILNASPARIKPHCKHFPECGGCQLQHIDYSEQLKYKTRMVREAVRRIGSISENTVIEITGMEHPWHYRNKAQFPAGQQDNIIKIGYYAPGSHTLVDVDHCLIQHKLNNKVLKVMKEIIKKYNLTVYYRKTGKGLIRHIGSKVSSCTGEVMVLLVTNGKKLPHQETIVEKLRQEIPELVSIVQNINTRKGNIILGDQDILLYGKPQITESIGELKYNISAQAFFQVNFSQTKVLYDKILNYAGLTGRETVMDLYCGTGSIALYLAPHSLKVYGIEINSSAVEDAKTNAHINNIENVEFIQGKAEELMPHLIKSEIKPDVVVVDPPRKGCAPKLLESIMQSASDKLIYVSCNPSTLARDLAVLTTDNYYEVQEIQPIDMFPHTTHVESIIQIIRN